MLTDEEIAIYHVILLDWYEKNKRSFPWRYTFNPYLVLVSEVLLQQTNAGRVISPYLKIVDKYKSISELACGDKDFLMNIFKEIGLFYRANRLLNIANEIVSEYSAEIPSSWGELIKLKGIGSYICSAILCFGFNKPYAVVDTNVIRIFDRIFNIKSESSTTHKDKKLWEFAQQLLPVDDYVDYNYALLDFAARVCTARNPKCRKCKFSYMCCFKNTVHDH